ncbi:MAG TPA: ABC transporter permease [Verrucomicrobiae bacterium]|nr:ABC transporter permease [Verrucomicrobiae bacterium]
MLFGSAAPFMRYWRNIGSASWLAIDSIWAHKLRSSLTLLGVIVGVASVVLVGAAIQGLGTYASDSTSKVFGSNTFLVAQVASAVSRTEYFAKLKQNRPIRPEDLKYLKLLTGDTIEYSAYNQRVEDIRREMLRSEGASIFGVAALLPEMREINLSDGRFFTDQEERSAQPVAVIGSEVADALFPNTYPVGQTVRIRDRVFTVVGVQEKVGSAFGNNQDNTAYIPFPIFVKMYGTGQSIAIFGRARPGTNLTVEDALDVTRVALRTRFHALPGHSDRFDSLTPEAMQSFITQLLSMISAVVVPVTLISLVVGGIVIMNIMLVSVTERTHEIGVRKSVGARRTDIRRQFLIEAVILAGLGGMTGVALGASFAMLLSRIAGLTLTITIQYVVLGLAVSGIVGVVSGWYPAVRASRLDPVDALRAE